MNRIDIQGAALVRQLRDIDYRLRSIEDRWDQFEAHVLTLLNSSAPKRSSAAQDLDTPISVPIAASYANESIQVIRKKLREGAIKGFKPKGAKSWRTTRRHILDYLESNEGVQPSAIDGADYLTKRKGA